jgi:hypothetical protein
MTVTLIRLLRRAFAERIRITESARSVFSHHHVPSSREDVPMPHNRRGLLFAGVAALALLFAGARTAQAQDAVVRGTITSDRGESGKVRLPLRAFAPALTIWKAVFHPH